MSPPPFDITAHVVRHGAALRALAIELVGDAATADDVVQQTWLGALRRPPRHDAAIGGWLATLLRNVVRGFNRRDRRRVRREAAVASARGFVAEDGVAMSARGDTARRLIAAVEALEPVYRTAIWQRFFEGRPPREIAAASGVPVETVKSRLKRGLATLRERLAEHEGTDWRAGVVAAFGLRDASVAGTAAVAAGGMLMATWAKVSAVALVAAAIAAMVWWPTPEPAAGPESARVGSAASPATAPLGERAPAVLSPSSPAAGERTAPPAATPRDPKLAVVRGRCVDDAGKPLAGGRLRIDSSPADSERYARWVLDHGEVRPVQLTSEPTRDDGVFALAFWPPPPCRYWLRVEHEAYAGFSGPLEMIAEGATIDLGDFVMSRGVRVRGRVVDTRGAPVAAAYVYVQAEPETRLRASSARGLDAIVYRDAHTDDAGRFDFERQLVPGRYTPLVQGDLTVQSPAMLELAVERPVEDVVIVVARPEVPTIRGKVVDEMDRPVRGVTVAAGHDGTSSKADGTFELRCLASDAKQPARLATGGEQFTKTEVPGEVAWGTRDLVVRLTLGSELALRVVDRDGMPVEQGRVHVEIADQRRSVPGGMRVLRTNLVDGTARFDRVEPGRYRAIVEFSRESGLLPIFAPVECTGVAQQIVLRAGTETVRRLRVLTAAGAPVAGTRVQLCEMLGNDFDPGNVVHEPGTWFRPTGGGRVLVLEEGTTDADGSLPVRGPADRPMGLRVLGPGHVPVERCDVLFTTDAELVVTVEVGARLRGRIGPDGVMDELRRLAHGEDANAAAEARRPIVQLCRGENPRRYLPAPLRTDAESARFRIDDDGAFDVPGLPAGRWHVQVRYWHASSDVAITKNVDVGDVTLRDGETTVLDPDLSRLLPGTLQAQVLRNGAPWANARLQLDCERGVRADGRPDVDPTPIETDADGRFSHVGGAGRYSLRHVAFAGSRRAHETVDVVRGGTARGTFTFAIGTLALRVLDPAGLPVRGATVLVQPGDGRGDTKDDGTVSFELSAGTVALHTLPKRLAAPEARRGLAKQAAASGVRDPFAAHLLPIGTATVVAGETATLELRLPPEWEK
ncbi:MAG TPA: RNA polymerase sigma factor [Planctomycetota bacterium]